MNNLKKINKGDKVNLPDYKGEFEYLGRNGVGCFHIFQQNNYKRLSLSSEELYHQGYISEE